jgi:Niemann-Pick C1 protein
MPDDSFVLKYFQFLNKYLSVGPPFYIVINNTRVKEGPDFGFDFSKFEYQNMICGGQNCNQDSLQATVLRRTLLIRFLMAEIDSEIFSIISR